MQEISALNFPDLLIASKSEFKKAFKSGFSLAEMEQLDPMAVVPFIALAAIGKVASLHSLSKSNPDQIILAQLKKLTGIPANAAITAFSPVAAQSGCNTVIYLEPNVNKASLEQQISSPLTCLVYETKTGTKKIAVAQLDLTSNTIHYSSHDLEAVNTLGIINEALGLIFNQESETIPNDISLSYEQSIIQAAVCAAHFDLNQSH